MKVHALLSKRGRSMIAIGAVATAIAINGLGSASAGAANPPAVPSCEASLTTEAQPGAATNGTPANPGAGAGTTEAGVKTDDAGMAQACAVAITGSSAPTVSVNVCISNGVTTTQSLPEFEVVPDQSSEAAPAAGGTNTAPESGTANANDASASATAGGTDAATSADPNAGAQPSSVVIADGGTSYSTQDGGVTTTVITQDPATGAQESQTVPAEAGTVADFSPAVIASETQQTCISISIGAGGAIEILPLTPGVGLPANGEAPADQGASTGGVVVVPAQPGAGAPSTTQPGQTAPQQQVPDSTPVPAR